MVPDFLAASFEMLKQGQDQMMENMTKANPLAKSFAPGMEAIRAQQEAFLKAMTGGLQMGTVPGHDDSGSEPEAEDSEELDAIRKQLSELQTKLSRMDK